MNPYKQRSICIATICMIALFMLLFSKQRDGFFAWFLVPGVISAMGFRWQCIHWVDKQSEGLKP